MDRLSAADTGVALFVREVVRYFFSDLCAWFGDAFGVVGRDEAVVSVGWLTRERFRQRFGIG